MALISNPADSLFAYDDWMAAHGRERSKPWMTWLLTASILAVYVAQLIESHHSFDRVGSALAFGPESFARHRYWTLLSYAWAHAVPATGLPWYAGFHLVTNMVPFFCIAPALERRRGPWWLLALFCGGAIASAMAWLAFHPRLSDSMIGASGSLFAIIAAAGTMRVQIWSADFIFFKVPMRLAMRTAALVICGLEAVQMLFRGLPDVAHIAHLGGAVFGVIFVLISPRQLR